MFGDLVLFRVWGGAGCIWDLEVEGVKGIGHRAGVGAALCSFGLLSARNCSGLLRMLELKFRRVYEVLVVRVWGLSSRVWDC